MSCAPGAGVFVKLWKLFVDIHRWALVKMSVNCKTSSLNGILPPSVKLRKQKDLLHGPNDFRKWRRKLLCLCILAAVTILCIWFFLRSGNGALGRKNNSPHSCEEKSQVCLQRFNVSKNQFHDLASLVYESDQIVSLQCSKDPGTKMSVTDGIACVLKTLCPTKQEIQLQGGWVGELVGLNNQCPLFDENTHGNINHSSVDDSSPFVSDSIPQDGGQNTLQTKEGGNYAVDHCKFCSLGLLKECWWLLVGMIVSCTFSGFHLKFRMRQKEKLVQHKPLLQQRQAMVQLKQQQPPPCPPKAAGKWMKTLLVLFVMAGITGSIWLFLHMHHQNVLRREETLSNMCDERARMLQDQFNVSMNHVHALAILVSTFHHGKNPSAIDQKTFSEYTERTSFERPLTSGVAYALKVTHSEREQFEKEHRWTIKKMGTDDQTLVRDCIPHKLDSAPDQDEYAPVIFSQETVSHIVSIDMMSGKEDRENILRARASGKGVLTSPFKLLKSNHLGVVLTFAVYNADLPPDATPEERIEATVGYLGASYDIPSLVEKLLQQLASKQTIVVNVYDTTNVSAPILMYGTDVIDTGLLRISNLDFGDPLRKHEMHCRFKQKAPLPWTAIIASMGALIITLLIGHIFHAAINRIAKVEEDYREMMELKARAEAADVAKSQFLATVSHEIRTPMNGVLGMLQMLMGTNLDAEQMEYAQTAHGSGKDLISIINEVLDQAKIESGRLELEAVPFDLRSVLDNVQLLFSGKSNEKEIELAIYVSNLVPDVVIGDPGRFRQIITNLVGNSIKFTKAGHVFVSVHLAEEVRNRHDVKDTVLKQALSLVEDTSTSNYNTVSGFPVVDRWKSWENFKSLSSNVEEPEMIRLLVTVEDTGVGIQKDAQSRIFTPFVQADSSTSRTYGGTGIGLSISKCLVDLMGGEIGFVSELNNGSTFSFTVSFRKGQSSSLDTKWQSCSPVDSEFRGWRALIIDKRIIRAEVTRYHLQRLGISVDISPSLQSACSYLSGASCKSVPADYAMVLVDKDVWDKETGITFYHLLKETKENGGAKVPLNLPKIFLLATTLSPDEQSELKSIGLVEKVLTRPLRLSVFFNSFQEALGNGRKSPVNRRKPVTLQTLLRDRRILVVDDNRVNRKVAEGALKKYGAIVTCVNSGKEALEMLKPPHKFDACFMDLQMPEMDGFEATEKIRAMETEVNEQIASGEASMEMIGNVRYWRTPILAMTADVIQATNEKCVKCGMDDYVSKPFEEEQLYNAVARFFESG